MRAPLFRCGVAATLLVAQAFSFVPTAFAQTAAAGTAKPKSLAETLTGEAKSRYDVALTLYRAGDFTNASAAFKEAYDSSKDPRLLWNMAACQKALRHYSEVQKLVNQYVTDGTASGVLTDADRKEARDLLAVIDSLVGLLQLDLAEPGAQIAIDNGVVATSPVSAPLTVDMGAHHLKVTKPDFIDFESDFSIKPGLSTRLKVKLVQHTHEGRISVRTSEKMSTISVDNKTLGASEFFGAVPVGTHLLRVTAPGYQPWQSDFVLTEGGVRTFEVTLRAEKKPVPKWVWIGGGILLAGGLAAASVGAAMALRGNDCKTPGTAVCPTGTMPTFGYDVQGKK